MKSKKQTVHPGKSLPATRGIPGERSAFASKHIICSTDCQELLAVGIVSSKMAFVLGFDRALP